MQALNNSKKASFARSQGANVLIVAVLLTIIYAVIAIFAPDTLAKFESFALIVISLTVGNGSIATVSYMYSQGKIDEAMVEKGEYVQPEYRS